MLQPLISSTKETSDKAGAINNHTGLFLYLPVVLFLISAFILHHRRRKLTISAYANATVNGCGGGGRHEGRLRAKHTGDGLTQEGRREDTKNSNGGRGLEPGQESDIYSI